MLQVTYVQVELTNIFEGWHEVDGIDQEESCNSYASALQERLKKILPSSVDVYVSCDHRYSGPSRVHTDASYEESEEIDWALESISDSLMNDCESWIVLTEKEAEQNV